MLESVIKWRPPRAPIYLFTQQVRGDFVAPCIDTLLSCIPLSPAGMGMSLYNYVRCELTRGHGLKDGQGLFSEKQRRVTRFMKTPRELEKVMMGHVSTINVPTLSSHYQQIH